MTRINLDAPSILIDQHLLGELHEIGRVWPLAIAALERAGSVESLRASCPDAFTLGTGHVRFFYPRLGWLWQRHASLIVGATQRNMRLRYTEPQPVPDGLDLPWTPTQTDRETSRQRLRESIARMKREPTVCGEPVSRRWYDGWSILSAA